MGILDLATTQRSQRLRQVLKADPAEIANPAYRRLPFLRRLRKEDARVAELYNCS
jgi:hypothetical protein